MCPRLIFRTICMVQPLQAVPWNPVSERFQLYLCGRQVTSLVGTSSTNCRRATRLQETLCVDRMYYLVTSLWSVVDLRKAYSFSQGDIRCNSIFSASEMELLVTGRSECSVQWPADRNIDFQSPCRDMGTHYH